MFAPDDVSFSSLLQTKGIGTWILASKNLGMFSKIEASIDGKR